MTGVHHTDLALLTLGLYLAALVVGVVAFRRFGLGAAPGYLVLGAVAGPAALGLLAGNATIDTLAEFGVVLLLFVVGLELRPRRVWSLRVDIFGLGFAQVFLCGAVLALILRATLGWDASACIVAGAALSLSSTAFGFQALIDRNELGTPFADRAVAVLLFQDLAVLPLLAMVSLLAATGSGEAVGSVPSFASAVLSLLVLGLAGHYLINPFFRQIVRFGGDEAFTPAALLVVVAAAWIMESAGLSMALGALIAGILLAESEYRHRVETAIAPFRSLFLGLFFLGVGAQVDVFAIGHRLHWVVGGAFLVFAVKGAVLFALARIRGSSVADSLRFAALLGQAGEFGFILFGLAAANGIVEPAAASSLTAVAAISMALTVVAVKLADRWIGKRRATDEPPPEERVRLSGVLVIGFGRFGQIVSRVLRQRGYRPLILDRSPERIRVARSLGFDAHFGDLDGSEFLSEAGKRGVKAIFVCVGAEGQRLRAVHRLRGLFPDAVLLARVPDRFAGWEALELGADHVEREVLEASFCMAREGLRRFGDVESAEEAVAVIRREEEALSERLRAYAISAEASNEAGEQAELRDGDGLPVDPEIGRLSFPERRDPLPAGSRRWLANRPLRGVDRLLRRLRRGIGKPFAKRGGRANGGGEGRPGRE